VTPRSRRSELTALFRFTVTLNQSEKRLERERFPQYGQRLKFRNAPRRERPSGYDHHRNLAPTGPELADDFPTGTTRQFDVEDDQVRLPHSHEVECSFGTRCEPYLDSSTAEIPCQDATQYRIVFDDQNTSESRFLLS